MFGLRLMFGFFCFASVFLFFFGLDLEKTKKTQGFFVFWIKWWLKKCEKQKKFKFFLGFWVFVALVSFWLRNKKPNKTLSFFGFSHFFNHHFIQNTKKPWVFLVFSRSRPKKIKKPRQNQKNPSDQTFSEKFWFFVFWFSRGLGYFVFPKIQPKSRKL